MEWQAFKIKNVKTGLYSAPGIIGFKWSKKGRTWSSKSALNSSFRVWEERIRNRPYLCATKPDDWVVLTLSERGSTETPVRDWLAARPTKQPARSKPSVVTLRFTDDEIEAVEEALRDHLGDADDAGYLALKVVEAMRHYYESH
jgi:hypothetical protein